MLSDMATASYRQKYQRNVNQGKERWIFVVTVVNAILNLVKNFLDNSGSIENPSNQVTAKLWIIPSPGIKKSWLRQNDAADSGLN